LPLTLETGLELGKKNDKMFILGKLIRRILMSSCTCEKFGDKKSPAESRQKWYTQLDLGIEHASGPRQGPNYWYIMYEIRQRAH
jgi:hypothetical protein